MPHPAIPAALAASVAFALCLPPAVAAVAVDAPAAAAPARTTCGLAAPPADAGIDHYLGTLLKIYPRNTRIGPDYGGCQTLWALADDGWQTITVAHYERGHVVRVESPARPGDPVERCRVKDGGVAAGDPALCAQLDDMRFESLPAQCIDGAAAGAACVRD